MFLQAAWPQVRSIINQLPRWYCTVYYCWTHQSSALKASDPWNVPVRVTVMDIIITVLLVLAIVLLLWAHLTYGTGQKFYSANTFPPGVYIYNMQTGEFSKKKKSKNTQKY